MRHGYRVTEDKTGYHRVSRVSLETLSEVDLVAAFISEQMADAIASRLLLEATGQQDFQGGGTGSGEESFAARLGAALRNADGGRVSRKPVRSGAA